MDILLSSVTKQAMNYAIRSGVALTASYAMKQSATLLASAPKSNTRDELLSLQQRLDQKIRIVSPAIDMIELIAARGNTSLETAVTLTREIRYQIQSLGQRIGRAAAASQTTSPSTIFLNQGRSQQEAEMKVIVVEVKNLLQQIEDSIPLLNLAITTSGAKLSVQLPSTVSPSRLLQASTFLTAGDTQYAMSPNQAVQIGPTFSLTVYMLFSGHVRPETEEEVRQTTWKEVIHKARVKIRRVPMNVVTGTGSGEEAMPSIEVGSSAVDTPAGAEEDIPAAARADEFAYQVMIIEDFDDDRVHDFEHADAKPAPFDDVKLAGVREIIPIHEMSKIFYADTGKVLKLGSDNDAHHPVLLLRRDVNAVPPRRMVGRGQAEENGETEEEKKAYRDEDHSDRKEDPWRLPAALDPEWVAFEVYEESSDSDDDDEELNSDSIPANAQTITNSLSSLHLNDTPASNNSSKEPQPSHSQSQFTTVQPPPWINSIKTSLSMLELLLRLTSLQQFQQQSHLSITDELLNFFLEESASTGAGGDQKYREALRTDARRRVGWDPYDESPMKRRGEEYQYQGGDGEYYEGTPSPGPRSPRYAESPRYKDSPRRDSGGGAGWSQTRSMTGMSESPGPSPASGKGREAWLRKENQKMPGSPLRPSTAVNGTGQMRDEGLGTSPVVPEKGESIYGQVTSAQ